MFIDVTVLPEDEWEEWLKTKTPQDTTATTPPASTPAKTASNSPVAMRSN
jgi:hypothetical protein